MRIGVTGSSGRLGLTVVDALRTAGHDVHGLDLTGPAGPGFTRVDLGDYGQILDALLGVTARFERLDALVHLAAIPVNGLVPDVSTFQQNAMASFNTLFAAHRVGITRIVLASSITAMGFPFTIAPPFLPVDERYTAAFTTYGLGKVADEAIASQLAQWTPGAAIAALRFTNIVGVDEYAGFARAAEPDYRRDLLGSYVDVRDAARAVVLAVEHARAGFERYVIAAPDSGSASPTRTLAERWFPGVPLDPGLESDASLLSSTKAREQLGFVAQHRWRDELRLS